MSNFEDRYGEEAFDPAYDRLGYAIMDKKLPSGCQHTHTQRCLFTAGSWHHVCNSCGMAKGESTSDEWKRLS